MSICLRVNLQAAYVGGTHDRGYWPVIYTLPMSQDQALLGDELQEDSAEI